jgi:hypothetical protein
MSTLREVERVAVRYWKSIGIMPDVIARKVLASRYEREYYEIYTEVKG